VLLGVVVVEALERLQQVDEPGRRALDPAAMLGERRCPAATA
jgi:hypothetical protein